MSKLPIMINEKDSLRRFLFSDAGVRGEWVSLNDTWRAIREKHDYPESVETNLGQAMAAVVLLAVTIKFKGSMILQTQGDGAMHMLVAQCGSDRNIRGMARYDKDKIANNIPQSLFGQGHLVLTIEQDKGDPYQGIVELNPDNLASSLQTYFDQSEQLATRLWLFANQQQAMGLLIQELPDQKKDPSDWERIEYLASTVTEQELMSLSCEQMLFRLFHEEQVRLFEVEKIGFKCSCSIKKIETTLLSFGRATLEDLLTHQRDIVVDCEFCNHQYFFDKVDVERLLSQSEWQMQVSDTRH